MAFSWRHNIYHCDDCGTCMGSFCCNPCLYGRTAHRLANYPLPPHQPPTFNHCNADCAIMCIATQFGVGWIMTWLQRREMRRRFGIEGNECTDCLAACCCTCCAQTQMEVEVRERAEDEKGSLQYMPMPADGMRYWQQLPAAPPPAPYADWKTQSTPAHNF